LTYFLGEQTKQVKETIEKISAKFGFEIIQLSNINDEKLYSVDPSEFIDFIHSAEMIITDSYHGTIFSIQMEKPFLVFERQSKTPSMSSRISTLLSTLKLEDRFGEHFDKIDDVLTIDYSHVAPILNQERCKVNEYLVNALALEKIANHEE
jgi:exopolysaccharide biosynthesis predicted pyruvyltransferase EpsI